jgi:hypothetical protein
MNIVPYYVPTEFSFTLPISKIVYSRNFFWGIFVPEYHKRCATVLVIGHNLSHVPKKRAFVFLKYHTRGFL